MNLIEKRLLIDDFEPKVSFYRNEEDYKQVFFPFNDTLFKVISLSVVRLILYHTMSGFNYIGWL